MHACFCEALNSALGIMHGGMDCDKLSNLSLYLYASLSYFGCPWNIPICSELYTTKNLKQKTNRSQQKPKTETAETQWTKKTKQILNNI